MSRTTRLYEIVKAFRSDVKEKQKELDEREKGIEDMKGSSRYAKVLAQIQQERADLLRSTRNRYAAESDIILAQMYKAAQESAPMQPPSAEALRTLQLYQMRLDQYQNAMRRGDTNGVQPLTAKELKSAIPLMGGNATALKTLQNIAGESGIILVIPKGTGLAEGAALDAVKALARSMKTLYSLPRIGNGKNYAEAISSEDPTISKNYAIDAFRIDRDFSTENDFIEGMAFIDAENVELLKGIVNQE